MSGGHSPRRKARAVLERGICSAGIGQPERIQIIKQLAEQNDTDKPTKTRLCELFGVLRSSYYNGITDKPISKALIELQALVRQVFEQSGKSA